MNKKNKNRVLNLAFQRQKKKQSTIKLKQSTNRRKALQKTNKVLKLKLKRPNQ